MGTGKKGQIEFSERVSIRFKVTKTDTPNTALVAELINFLDLKVSMGIHQQWIKEAILEKFLKERAECAPGGVVQPAKSLERFESVEAPLSSLVEPQVVAKVRGGPQQADADGAGADGSEPVAMPRVAGLPKGMASLMQ